MKIVITGASGQLGTELQRCFAAGRTELGDLPEKLRHATIIPTDVDTLDITNRHEVEAFLRRYQPDAIISCAAFTNVNLCESERDAAYKINALGVRNLAMAAEEVSAKLLHVSTDYVFAGDAIEPVAEYELPNPQSVYGKTKLAGEQYAQMLCSRTFIVRTAWLYGYAGNNFVKTILKVAKKNGKCAVVNDQFGNPTNAADLAHHIIKLLPTKEYGVYHCTGEGVCSWYDFAAEFVRLSGIDAVVTPCTTDEYPTPAKRPAYSALDNMTLRNTIGNEMRNWKDALACFFENYKPEE